MPFVNPTADPTFPAFYNVEKAVGKDGANQREDVRLVQYMIRHLYKEKASTLAVDGFWGYHTARWIAKFQADAKAGGMSIATDGRVDRAMGTVSSVSKTTYTIVWLNVLLRKANPAAYAALPSVVKLTPIQNAGSPYSPYPGPQPGLIPETGGF